MQEYQLYIENEDIPSVKTVSQRVRRTTLGYGLFFLAYVASSLLLSVIVGLVAPGWEEQTWFQFAMSVIPLYGIGFPVLLAVVKDVPTGGTVKKNLSALDIFLLFPMCVALMILGNLVTTFLMTYLSSIFPAIDQSNPVSEAFGDSEMLMMVVLTVVIAPIMEELICRKILLDRVRPLGETVSIFLSGLIFGAIHGNVHQFFYATLLGMLLAFIYLKTGRIIYPMLLHMLVNFFCGVLPTLLAGDWMDLLSGDSMAEIQLTVPLLKGMFWLLNYVIAEYSLVAVGVVLIVIFFRQIHRSITPSDFRPIRQFSAAFLNLGMLLLFAISFGLMCLNLLA